MNTSLKRRLAGFSAVTVLAATPLIAAAPAQAAVPGCRAWMSDATPKQYSNAFVQVKTAPYASVRTVAHYKTTNTAHTGKADGHGRRTQKYYISSATAHFRVWVDVYVTKAGHSNHCRTSFVPHS